MSETDEQRVESQRQLRLLINGSRVTQIIAVSA
jgi:hypothetical protein